MANEVHYSANDTRWTDPGGWYCEKCNKAEGRVIRLGNGAYYCEPCLLSAVIDGDIEVGSGIDCYNCGDRLDRYAVCSGCGSHDDCSSGGCESCGRSYDVYCTECHEDACSMCGDTGEVLCETCQGGGCQDCGAKSDWDVVIVCMSCARERLNEETAVAAQSFKTEDGTTFHGDDGIVVSWG